MGSGGVPRFIGRTRAAGAASQGGGKQPRWPVEFNAVSWLGGKASGRAESVRESACRAATSTVWARGSVHLRTSQTQFRPSLCVNTPPSAEATQTKPAMDRVKRPGAGMSQAISSSDFGCHASIADHAIVNETRERRAVHLIRAGSPHGQDCKYNRNAVTTDYRRKS